MKQRNKERKKERNNQRKKQKAPMNKNKIVRKQPLPSENYRYRPETCQGFHFLGKEITTNGTTTNSKQTTVCQKTSVVSAIVEVLDSRGTCEFPLSKITECYATSTNGVIDRCVGSLDGIAIEIIQPARRHAPKKFRSRKG